jgi:hypothetical protein
MGERKEILLIIFLTILFVINKEFLRPYFSNVIIIKDILGSLPNFIGAFMFSLFFINKALKLEYKKGLSIMVISAVIVFLILTKEEFRPYLLASKTFDILDILFSAIGAAASIYFFKYSYKLDTGQNQIKPS